MAHVIDGKKIAASIVLAVKEASLALEAKTGVKAGLAVIIAGDDPASHAYVNSKSRTAKECGFKSVQHTLPADVSQDALSAIIHALNCDESINGILVQLPLPSHINSALIIQSIVAQKDVDGLNVINAGKLATGDLKTGLVSCTPAGAMLLAKRHHGDDLSGLNAVVIGRSNLFGKPMSQLLLLANATVTTAHSRTRNLADVCRNADIVVAAVGRPELIRGDWVKPGATVIDVGINRVPAPEKGLGKTKIVGDVAFSEVLNVASIITPVPGGVGPMTIAMLMVNTVIAAYRAARIDAPQF